MKVRNKKTGEIGKLLKLQDDDDLEVMTDDKCYRYKTIAEVVEHWEDYEEPKEFWYLDSNGDKLCEPSDDRCQFDMDCKEIGNYFGTKEEAEKAVEKLKAWKRLKDKGFERVFSLQLRDALCGGKTAEFKLLIDDKGLVEDIKLLFGGEE